MWGLSQTRRKERNKARRRPPINMTPFHKRKFWALHGPYPVERNQGRWGFERKAWFDTDRANARHFEIHYGYNPRCQFRGTWNKPGTGKVLREFRERLNHVKIMRGELTVEAVEIDLEDL